MFITVSHFHSRQIFAKEANSLPLDWSVIKSYTREGSSHACKYKSRVEVNDSDIHFSLLQNKILITDVKGFIVQGLSQLNQNHVK